MKISYNPKSSQAAITPQIAANDDIIFDLYASKLWAKGTRIGADWADISSKPSSLKNPYALTLKANGTILATYDGSSSKEANFTYANVGAASAYHTHTYIVAEDFRSSYPGQILDPKRMKLSFLSASTLGIKGGSGYYDVITVRSYGDSSGGCDNALIFSKNTKSLYHTSFEFGSTSSWGTPLLIIDSANIGSQSVKYANSAGNADTLDNYHANGLFTAFGNDGNNISATIGTVTKKFEVKYSNHSYYSRFIKGEDQRNANNAPNYYMNTFGDASLCTEFSQQGKQFGNGTYVNLITSTPWRDSGGGRPAQLAIGNYIGLRSATNDSTWGAWRTIPTIDANGVMEIGKFIDLHWNNEIYGSQDFSTRLQAQNTSSYPNTVYLPTQSGELALLDQVELSQYHVVDMRNYDSGYWHPVTVGLPKRGYNKIKVSVELDIGDKPSWATHDSGFTCNMEIWATAHGWGTTNAETICLNYTYRYCNSNPCGWEQLGYPSLGVLFLRGGSRYKVWADFDATFTPHDKTYTWTNGGGTTQSTGGPYTSCPGLNFNKNRIYANLDGTADNADKLDGYHASYSSSTPWGTIPVITTQGFMDIGKHLEFHYNNTTGSDYSTLLTCTGNYSNIVNLPSESGTLALLSQVVSTSDFNWTNLPGKVVAGNEFNIVSAGYNNTLAINYLPIDNRNGSATITQYNIYNGNKGLASVYAHRFKVDGQSCMLKDARNYAPFYSTYNGGFEPILDIKTVSGDWSIGSYDSYGNHLVFAFTSDSDFNAGRNGTAQYYLTAGGEFKINTLRLAGTNTANMGVGSTNPQIIFAEGSTTQQVALTYTDWDSYRVSKGLKVHSYDGSDDSNVWFEVQGYNYSSGYVKNGSSDAYVLLGGGGHKPLSEFSANTANVAGTIKIWEHESNDSWYYVTWTTQNGTGYGSIYESTASLQYNPSQKTLWTGGGLRASQYVKAASIRLENTNEINSYSGDLYLNHRNTASGSEGHTANIRMCGTGGSVIIGANDAPSYQLDVRGNVIASSWLRTRGNSGWYSESYGGGIYMTDTSWIRTYGGKPFYCNNQIYSSDSIRMNSIYLHHNNEINNADNGKLHLNYRNTGNVTICNGGGAVTIGSTTDDIEGNKLYVSGSEFIDGASNVKNHVFADGFKHRSHNSNDSVLLAGGGYSQGVPVKYWSIDGIYIYSSTAVSHENRGGNYTFITNIESCTNGACTLTLQFPSGYDSYNTMIWAMGRVNDSGSHIYATITHFSGPKYHLLLADDATLNNGSCQLFFLCF